MRFRRRKHHADANLRFMLKGLVDSDDRMLQWQRNNLRERERAKVSGRQVAATVHPQHPCAKPCSSRSRFSHVDTRCHRRPCNVLLVGSGLRCSSADHPLQVVAITRYMSSHRARQHSANCAPLRPDVPRQTPARQRGSNPEPLEAPGEVCNTCFPNSSPMTPEESSIASPPTK